MDTDNIKLCIVCCHSFAISDQAEHGEKVTKLCTDIHSYHTNSVQEQVFLNQINFSEELKRLEDSCDSSICTNCLFDLNELITSKENMSLLENHVISLQQKILKGLRKIEECQQLIKCYQDKVRITVEKSDVSCLEKRFLSDVNQTFGDSSSFSFKLRQWITNDALQCINRKLEGSLSISPTEKNKRKVFIKVEEPEPQLDDHDHHFDSNSFWDASAEHEQLIKTDPQQITNERKKKPRIKYEKPSTLSMSLRKRAIKPNDKPQPVIISPPPPTTNSLKPKRKKTSTTSSKNLSEKKIQHLNKLATKRSKSGSGKSAKYSCELCSYNTMQLLRFEQHLKEHEDPNSSNALLKCSQCPSEFSTNQYLQFHQKSHQDIYKMCCDICSKFFPILDLRNHIKSHFSMNPPPKIIFCRNCSFCCTTPQAYLSHCQRHYVSETAKFPCSICPEEFCYFMKLIRHYTQAHPDILDKWTCDVETCSKVFPSKYTMLAHKRLEHKIKCRVVPCKDSSCGKMFTSIKSMEFHYCSHSGEKPFPCELCEERFLHRDGLTQHRRRVHGAEKPKCKICGVEFLCPRTLKVHVALHENKGVSCEICGRVFGKKALKEHMWTHSETTRWTCDQCGKGFKSRDGWVDHMAAHEQRKNLKCEYCGKGFVRKSNLRDHLRVHTGERPYICDVCGKDFNQASALRIHKRKQHQ